MSCVTCALPKSARQSLDTYWRRRLGRRAGAGPCKVCALCTSTTAAQDSQRPRLLSDAGNMIAFDFIGACVSDTAPVRGAELTQAGVRGQMRSQPAARALSDKRVADAFQARKLPWWTRVTKNTSQTGPIHNRSQQRVENAFLNQRV